MTNNADEKKENNDDAGAIFEVHQLIRDLLSEYNDSVKGRCNVCFDNFVAEDDDADQSFTDRQDLARIGGCYHRFHLICLWRYWFMPRHKDKDKYGDVIEYKLPEVKRCPVCRKEDSEAEINFIQKAYDQHPELENHEY